jgi:hypothetical protein
MTRTYALVPLLVAAMVASTPATAAASRTEAVKAIAPNSAEGRAIRAQIRELDAQIFYTYRSGPRTVPYGDGPSSSYHLLGGYSGYDSSFQGRYSSWLSNAYRTSSPYVTTGAHYGSGFSSYLGYASRISDYGGGYRSGMSGPHGRSWAAAREERMRKVNALKEQRALLKAMLAPSS